MFLIFKGLVIKIPPYFYFMCFSVLSLCRSMYHMHAWYLRRSEESRFPETGVCHVFEWMI